MLALEQLHEAAERRARGHVDAVPLGVRRRHGHPHALPDVLRQRRARLVEGVRLAHRVRQDLLLVAARDLARVARLRHLEAVDGEGVGRVAEGDLGLALQELHELHAHERRRAGRRRGDGRDDLPRDHLHLVARRLLDAVVAAAQVRRRGHEVDVEVLVQVLLEVRRLRLGPGELAAHGAQLRQEARELRDEVLDALRRRRLLRFLRILLRLDLLAARGPVLHGVARERRAHRRLGAPLVRLRHEGVELLAVLVAPVLRQRLQAVGHGEEVRDGDHEGEHGGLRERQLEHGGEALRGHPEGLAVRGHVVARELVDEVAHAVIVELVEQVRREAHAGREALGLHLGERLGRRQQPRALLVVDGLDGLAQVVRVHHVGLRVLAQVVDVAVGVIEEVPQRAHGRYEEVLELAPRPLDAVHDGAREVPQRAHGDGLAGRRLGVPLVVALRERRQHDHGVELGALRAGLEQRLVEEDAAAVHVLARLHRVQRVRHKVNAEAASGPLGHVVGIRHARAGPEVVVEDVLRGGHGEQLEAPHLDGRVHELDALRRRRRLGRAHVLRPEEELPVQIGHLDAVAVRHRHEPLLAGGDAEQRKVLEELAAERAAAHHEGLGVHDLVLHVLPEERHVVCVAARRRRGGRRRGVRQHLDAVEVQPLVQRRELARVLDDLLRHDAADEAAERLELHPGGVGELLDGRDGLKGVHLNLLRRERVHGGRVGEERHHGVLRVPARALQGEVRAHLVEPHALPQALDGVLLLLRKRSHVRRRHGLAGEVQRHAAGLRLAAEAAKLRHGRVVGLRDAHDLGGLGLVVGRRKAAVRGVEGEERLLGNVQQRVPPALLLLVAVTAHERGEALCDGLLQHGAEALVVVHHGLEHLLKHAAALVGRVAAGVADLELVEVLDARHARGLAAVLVAHEEVFGQVAALAGELRHALEAVGLVGILHELARLLVPHAHPELLLTLLAVAAEAARHDELLGDGLPDVLHAPGARRVDGVAELAQASLILAVHALHLGERHVAAVLRVLHVVRLRELGGVRVHELDDAVLLAADARDGARHRRLTRLVVHEEVVAKVAKHVGESAHGRRADELDGALPRHALAARVGHHHLVLPAEGVPADELLASQVRRRDDKHVVLPHQFLRKPALVHAHAYEGVELLQPRRANTRTRRADVLLADVEVGSEVLDPSVLVVHERNRAGAGEHEVLRRLNAHTAEAVDEHLHVHELAHGLYAERPDLPAV
mmetsp:Transcript_22489/g.69658  ORF Transcript_22489/g.69658 Transcript_22489/m.69658 type:complete len:1232 (-) Transcript_22489:429-4124(-)